MKPDKVLSLIGLAKKAGKVVSGELSTEEAVKKNKAKLVIIATDASNNTKKLFTNKCAYYHIPIVEYKGKDSLGKAIGCQMRTSVGILDEGLATSIRNQLESSSEDIK